MEEAGVPVFYTDQLKEIYFTILPGTPRTTLEGDYVGHGLTQYKGPRPRVRLSYTAESLPKALIHELGHHIDVLEDICSRADVVKEFEAHKKKTAELIEGGYEKRTVGEYVAGGFEMYYFGDRKWFKKHRRVLHDVISSCHRKYTGK